MPWPWELIRHCTDNERISFLQWPLEGGWARNKDILRYMEIVMEVVRFCSRIKRQKYEWTEGDQRLFDEINTGRPMVITLSRAEKWAVEKGYETEAEIVAKKRRIAEEAGETAVYYGN